MSNRCTNEGRAICAALHKNMPSDWDGKECIQALKDGDYHWRQMEWIGWYNEFKANQVVRGALGGGNGPRYRNTGFDYCRECVWDFKVHPAGDPWMILNDQEAVDACIAEHGAAGFVVTLGDTEYDDVTGTFKRWHDGLKGKISRYEEKRVARGAPSRRRKVRFRVTGFVALVLDKGAVQTGLREEWIRMFQEGMRNADGSPRRPKYMVDMNRIPESIRVAQRRL